MTISCVRPSHFKLDAKVEGYAHVQVLVLTFSRLHFCFIQGQSAWRV